MAKGFSQLSVVSVFTIAIILVITMCFVFNTCGCQAMKTVELTETFAQPAVDYLPSVLNDQNYIAGQLTVDGRNNRFGKKSFIPTEDGNIVLRPEAEGGKIAIGDENTKSIVLGSDDTKIRLGKIDRISASEFESDVLKLGKKWRLSGVGDAHGNDDWLRFFDGNNNGYYGGIAVGKLWNGGETWLNGQLNAYGKASLHKGLDVQGGKSVHNPNGHWTHFPWEGDGKNYIRGDTELAGEMQIYGGINMLRTDPGAMVQKQYGDDKANRYGVGQFPGAKMRMYTAGSVGPATVNLSVAKEDGTFDDVLAVDNKGNTKVKGGMNIAGETQIGGRASIGGDISVGKKLFIGTVGSETMPNWAQNSSDPYYFEKVVNGANNSRLRLTVNDDRDEGFEIYGNSCGKSPNNCFNEGSKQHFFGADGTAWHNAQVCVADTCLTADNIKQLKANAKIKS